MVHWKLHIVTATLQNYKFVENLWQIYVSLLAVYVTLQQPQKVSRSDAYTVELWQVHGVIAASTRKAALAICADTFSCNLKSYLIST